MAFGKFTNDYNVRAKASSLSSTDEGLRKFMLKVYGYMSVGLGITGVIAWLFANAFVAQNTICCFSYATTTCLSSNVCPSGYYIMDEFWYK